MPSLKDLNCSIELSNENKTLQEFGTTYSDGVVETFVLVTSRKEPFSIHLTSNKLIAPGVAMYVFIDGVYQCNRNKQNSKVRKTSNTRSVVDFRVRQKEERQKDGSMLAREWTFEKLRTGQSTSSVTSASSVDSIGSIEVIVLRCQGHRNAKSVAQLDGTNDSPDYYLTQNTSARTSTPRSMYDDRGPFIHGLYSYGHGALPPFSNYKSPYVETERSGDGRHSHRMKFTFDERDQHRRHPACSEPVSPRSHRATSIPPGMVHYGSGPIPRSIPQIAATAANHLNGAEPQWLNEMLTRAVKQGVAEARKQDQSEKEHTAQPLQYVEADSPVPGGWPQSPIPWESASQSKTASKIKLNTQDAAWTSSDDDDKWKEEPMRKGAGTHVTWDAKSSGVWETSSSSSSSNEETSLEDIPTDSWDTEETWATKNKAEKESKNSEWGHSRVPSRRSTNHDLQPSSSVRTKTRRSHRYSEDHPVRNFSRSRSRHESRSREIDMSSEDGESWEFIKKPSTLPASRNTSESTITPSRVFTKPNTSRSSGKKHSHRSAASRHWNEPKPKSHSSRRASSAWHQDATVVSPEQALSMESHKVPMIVNAPVSIPAFPTQPIVQEPAPWIVPLPTWDYLSPVQPKNVEEEKDKADVWDTTGKDNDLDNDWGTTDDKDVEWDVNTKPRSLVNAWETPNEDVNAEWDTTSKVREVANEWDNPKTEVRKGSEKSRTASAVTWEQKEDEWAKYDTAKSTKPASIVPIDRVWAVPRESSMSYKHSSFKNNKSQSRKTSHVTTTIVKPPANAIPSSRKPSKSLYHTPSLLPQPHWRFPPPPPPPPPPASHSSKKNNQPLISVPSSIATSKRLDHQVNVGAPTSYGHELGRPEYLDRLDAPYAVFRFKYRSEDVLRRMFGTNMDEKLEKDKKSGKMPVKEIKDVRKMSRAELLEETERVRKQLEKKEKRSRKESGTWKETEKERKVSETRTEGVARGLTEKWVEQQSREASLKGKSARGSGSVKKDKEEKRNEWDDGGWAKEKSTGGSVRKEKEAKNEWDNGSWPKGAGDADDGESGNW